MKAMSPVDKEIDELIDSLVYYSSSLKEQKDNAIKNSGSFRNGGMLYALNEINIILKTLDKKLNRI